jgi:tryptophan halogenase
MTVEKKINNIVIVGGGNTGWLAAATLIDRIPVQANTKIILVESPDVPLIGVGESTTAQLRKLVKNAYFLGNEEEFLRETGSTYKYGIVHSDWKTLGKKFYSPIGGDFYNETRFPNENYDYMRIYHIANNLPYDYVYQSQCMANNKIFYINGEPNNYYKDFIGESGYAFLNTTDVAYHLDSYKVNEYIRKKCLDTKRISRIEATIKEVVRDSEGYVESLRLDNDQEISGDLFFDCTGFSRVLKLEENKFNSYGDTLLLDTAIIFPEQNEDFGKTEVETYTHAKAMKYGWMFEIPLQERTGKGYNFSSKYTTPEEAKIEVEKMYGREIDVKKVIKYDPGSVDIFWDKNVISSGIASGFFEPLEATTIHASLKQVEHFIEVYYHNELDIRSNQAIKNQYNKEMKYFYQDLRDFIHFHYQNTRQDTDFWIDASSKDKLSDKLKNNFEMWKTRMPRVDDYSEGKMNNALGLGNALWLQVGMGMNLFNSNLAKKELEYYNLYNIAKNQLKNIKDFSGYCIPKSMDASKYYDMIKDK